MRPHRVIAVSLLATLAAGGCGEAPVEADESGAVCPPEDPDCDRIDEPCVPEEGSGELGPGSSPTGLGGPLTSTGKHQIWPKGRVPYKIGSTVNSTTKSRLLTAMGEWEAKTKNVVNFVAATSTDKAYVLVGEGSPRVEFVGYRSGTVSKLYLRDSEYLTVTRHELGHVLGLEHEHRRKDRGAYIQVISGNIVNSSLCQYQFALCKDCALLDKYNTTSVMHYRSTRDLSSCRVGGKAVLLTKSGGLINHEWVINSGDVKSIWELYGSPPVPDAGTGGTGGAKDAGADAAKDAASGDGAVDAGVAGAGGTAGTAGASGAAGAAGDEGIDEPGWAGAPGVDGAAGGGGQSSQNTKVVPDDEGGCGCRTAPAREHGAWWVLAVAALAVTGRSRRFGQRASPSRQRW
jgi:MYXO-CTERM domain-containing protein